MEGLSPCHLLTVRIIGMKNVRQADILSQTDCFVTLWLPTASQKKLRTRTISNCLHPEWDESFTFQIQTQVKNVLELSICDEDTLTQNDHLLTVLYDLSKLCLRNKTHVKFPLNPEGMEELEVEFLLEENLSSSETLITNGVLVVLIHKAEHSLGPAPMNMTPISPSLLPGGSCRIQEAEEEEEKDEDLLVKVTDSFENTQSVPPRLEPCYPSPACFHYPKYSQPQLYAEASESHWDCRLCCCGAHRNGPVCQPLDCLSDGEVTTLPGENYELHMKSSPCSGALDVRLGFSLCQEELDFLQKRKVVVAKALSQVLQLEEGLCEDEVPMIAIMATGGGTRSMVSLYGHLLGLQKLNLLDCSTYLTGLSGATWVSLCSPGCPGTHSVDQAGLELRNPPASASQVLGLQACTTTTRLPVGFLDEEPAETMATLYSDPEWSSKNLEPVVFEARRHVVKDKMPALFPDQLCKWREELQQHSQEGYKTTFTDFWGKLVEYSLGDKKNECKLSDQRAALCQGQNPLPIYLTINVKDDVSNQDFREWFEFSPYEVGMQKYGAFIPSELFGSEFFMGRLMKRIPEPEMCYMLGLWSSIFSLNLLDAWNLSHTSEEFFYRWTREKLHDIEDDPLLPEIPRCDDNPLETTVVIPATWLSNTFREILTHRPFSSEFHNFLYGLQLHTDYLQNRQFSMWKDTVLDTFPNQLTQFTKHLYLLDTAFFVNSSYAPLLRSERKVDLIIHLNYCSGSQTKPLKQTCEYCTEQNIPFPSYSIQEDDKNLKECYLMENPQELDAPIVAYFPLINDTFQKYKAPGVERSPEELELGQLNIYGPKSPYATKELTYTEANFDKLVKLSEYNILNNKDKLMQALRLAMEKKRMRNQCSS
ncbi:Cytosolic phospholipase A2 epsilon [Apodemus speciosus]|uniref:Phospholipase A2 n=1 Tax=Apodemus speciosus TaxID=105296 RepID=A0ABQ0EI29_APOSI